MEDLYGIPFPEKYNNKMYLEYLKPKEFPGLVDPTSYGLFFIDEITTTTNEPLLAGLLQLLTDRKIAAYTLPRTWYVVAAGNRKEDGNIYKLLPYPVRNRMEIYDVKFSKLEFLNYLQYKGVSSVITGFIASRDSDKDYLTYRPELEEDGVDMSPTNYVCASPRTWEKLDEKLKGMQKLSKFKASMTSHKEMSETRKDYLEAMKSMGHDMNPNDVLYKNTIIALNNVPDQYKESVNRYQEAYKNAVQQQMSASEYEYLNEIFGGILGADLGETFRRYYYDNIEDAEYEEKLLAKISELDANIAAGGVNIATEQDKQLIKELGQNAVNLKTQAKTKDFIRLISRYELTEDLFTETQIYLHNKDVIKQLQKAIQVMGDDKPLQWFKKNHAKLVTTTEDISTLDLAESVEKAVWG